MSFQPRRVIPLIALALLMMIALPFRGAAQAQTTQSGTAQQITNPLVLSNTQTGARVQIMPTTAWLAQHNIPFGSPSGSSGSATSSTTGGLPAPTCTLAQDYSPGDAHVLVSSASTQFDSLDLSAFGLSSDATNITGQISAQSLSNGTPVSGTPAPATPRVAGGGDIWYIVWNYGSTPGIKGYFLEAEYPGDPSRSGFVDNASTSNLPVNFGWGTIVTSATGGEQFSSGGAATGNFDTTNNRVSITAPLSKLGTATTGGTLSSVYAAGDALVGTSASGGLLENADTLASTSNDYQVGNSGAFCPTPKQAATSSSLPTAGISNNLAYFGGPVVHTIKNYVIFWLPKAGTTTYSNGASCTIPGTASYSYEQPASGTKPVGALPGGPDGDLDYRVTVKQYFNDLSGTSFYNLLTQYADTATGATNNNQILGGSWSDSCGYTSTPTATAPPIPGGTQAAPVYQTDIQAEVQRAMSVNHWPSGLNNQYYVYTGYGVSDCFAPPGQASAVPTCSVAGPNPGYCAYHGDFQDGNGNYVLYADMADGAFAANPSSINLCYTSPIGVNDPTHTVNGKQITDPIADAEVSITSHEQYETVTDAQVGTAQQYAPPLAWYEKVGGEIGDKCAYIYGNVATDGSNVNLHGDHYIVQEEYSNWNNGCAVTSYQSNGGYGGNSDSITIQKGLNLISVPVSGITDTAQLVADMQRAGQLPAGSITQVQLYHNGAYQTYTPGTSAALPLARTDGILVTSSASGTWTPTGTVYTSAPTISLHSGWNLVAATYPNPGLMTDTIYNEIAAQANACGVGVLTNKACSPTITQIKTIGTYGQPIVWTPTAADSSGNAVWPQAIGNQVPFTAGMWIYATKALTWTVQGSACQSVDSAGVCH
jgi:hypothetical protein